MIYPVLTSTRAIIVASGPSAKNFTPPPDITIIAVNGAIGWLPRADHFFTLDPSADNIARLRKRRDGVIYHAAGLKSPINGVNAYHRLARRGPQPQVKGTPEWWLWRWSAVCGLSEDKNKIHSGNSAYGALGLAYHLGFKKVALIGVDATSQPRIEGGTSNNLSHLPLLFASARRQIDVVSCGQLTGIPQMSLEAWCQRG
ncbi:hypothetical protein [Pseudescherichia sp.]|uniref:hypothetical protein n=1 Tax=Pseudescherichia sp. TaxID=2055881 RepID=UPI00289C42C2|nr:hypothetical protein [Pseudescherichia sp.]